MCIYIIYIYIYIHYVVGWRWFQFPFTTHKRLWSKLNKLGTLYTPIGLYMLLIRTSKDPKELQQLGAWIEVRGEGWASPGFPEGPYKTIQTILRSHIVDYEITEAVHEVTN